MRLEFPAPLRSRIRRDLVAAGRREIGGVLMGEQLAPGHFRIVDFSVDPRSGGGAHFVRRPEYHREALEEFFARTESEFDRFNYLGEWHSHPSFPTIPSQQDVNAMHCLVEHEQEISFSVLLIVRTRWRFMLDYSALLFQRGGYKSKVTFV
ncbi:MAG TPA: Mov34/MPN/PAD-1 family protein [Hyphomonas sp.]|nr:Mov34/MPN/PAD-1 family protein [Hyphomonas sp.]